MTARLLSMSVEDLLDAVADHAPTPGGGGVSAIVTALAAGLAGMAARFSQAQSPGQFGEVAVRADRLRHDVSALADDDAAAYRAYLAAVRLPREPDPEARRRAVAAATDAAADVPLAIVRAAAEVAEMGADLARNGNRNLRGDAAAAAMLAAAAAGSAAFLVAENLARTPEDPRLATAAELTARARAAADLATAADRTAADRAAADRTAADQAGDSAASEGTT